MQTDRLMPFTLPHTAKAVGCRLQDLHLEVDQVRLVQWRRASGVNQPVSPETTLLSGDTLVLSGSSEALAVAMDRLSKS